MSLGSARTDDRKHMSLPYRVEGEPSAEKLRAQAIARAWSDLRSRMRLQWGVFFGFIPFGVLDIGLFDGAAGGKAVITWMLVGYGAFYSLVAWRVWSFRCPVCARAYSIRSPLAARCTHCGAHPEP